MQTIKKYFTLGEHAQIGPNVKPFYSSELKWSYLIPDMPSSAAWIDTDPQLSRLLTEYIWPEFYEEAVEVEVLEATHPDADPVPEREAEFGKDVEEKEGE